MQRILGEDIYSREISGIEDTKFWWGVSARPRKCRLRMHIFTEKHPHVIKNVGCRCKICEGSIFRSPIRQDADAILTWQAGWKASASSKKSKLQIPRSKKWHLQQRISRQCRYIGLKNSICNNEYQGSVDTSAKIRASATANKSRM